MLRTEELLDTIPENVLLKNLKKRILNSIDYNMYQPKQSKSFIPESISKIFFGSKIKTAMSFGLVLIISGILFSAMFFNSAFKDLVGENNTIGTIGLSEMKLLESININSENILGNINIEKGKNEYKFSIDINSPEKYKLQIEFDPEYISLKNYPAKNYIVVSDNQSSVIFENSTRLTDEIIFISKNNSTDKFSVKLLKSDNKVFEKELIL
ncbi:MAG: hypothetical protein H6613_12650 [Ignavibacteriales bacterium]|nr:hypothetical protein [Ignavibacteriales bacterium]